MPKFKLEVTFTATVNGDEIQHQGMVEVDSHDALADPICELSKDLLMKVLQEVKEQFGDTP